MNLISLFQAAALFTVTATALAIFIADQLERKRQHARDLRAHMLRASKLAE